MKLVQPVTGQKTKMAAAVILAILLAFLLVGISYIFFANPTSQQPDSNKVIPIREPLIDQLLWAIQWIGLAALTSIAVVGTVLFINRIMSNKTLKHVE